MAGLQVLSETPSESDLMQAWQNIIHGRLIEEGLALLRQGFQPTCLDDLAARVVHTTTILDICETLADLLDLPVPHVQKALQEETKRAVLYQMTDENT